MIDEFLSEVKKQNGEKSKAFDTAKYLLQSDISTYLTLGKELELPRTTVRARIMATCEYLGLDSTGITPLRVAYIRFLESKI